MADEEKNPTEATEEKVAKKKSAKTPPVDLIEEINKIDNAGEEQPGLDLVNAAVKSLEDYIATKPDDAGATRASLKALKATVKGFKSDKDGNYKTPKARKLAGLVSDFLRLKSGDKTSKLKTGAKTLDDHHIAITFKDRVNKASEENSFDWIAEDLTELVEKIPSLSETGVKIKKDLESAVTNATKSGKKFSHKVYRYTKTYFNAGKDPNTDAVTRNKNKNYVARPASELKKSL
jgi:hypothetical protein